MSPRRVAVIQSEIAEIRRHLTDVPPHSGSGIRDDLHAKLNGLERELAQARAAEAQDADRGDADAPLGPAQVAAYLTRIGARSPEGTDAATLRALHRAHVMAVPFENVDIVDGRGLRLTVPELFDKVVTRRRGGYCFELNGLFAALLRSLGFDVVMVAASGESSAGPGSDLDHLRLLVTDDAAQRWVVDVGNGASWPAPLPLQDGAEIDLGHAHVRVTRDDDGWWTWTRATDGDDWQREWRFDEQPRELSEFAPRSRWHESSPDSPFSQGLLCTRTVDGGRLTLTKERLVLTRADGREEEPVDDVDEVLLTHFGIDRHRG